MEHNGLQFGMKQLDQSKQIDLQQGKSCTTAYKQESICPRRTISLNCFFICYIFICIFFIKERKEECLYVRNSSPIVPHTWYHICVGINTVSGLLRIVDNGIPVLDEETEIFKETYSIKPENISGKLLGDTIMIQIPFFGSDILHLSCLMPSL